MIFVMVKNCFLLTLYVASFSAFFESLAQNTSLDEKPSNYFVGRKIFLMVRRPIIVSSMLFSFFFLALIFWEFLFASREKKKLIRELYFLVKVITHSKVCFNINLILIFSSERKYLITHKEIQSFLITFVVLCTVFSTCCWKQKCFLNSWNCFSHIQLVFALLPIWSSVWINSFRYFIVNQSRTFRFNVHHQHSARLRVN